MKRKVLIPLIVLFVVNITAAVLIRATAYDRLGYWILYVFWGAVAAFIAAVIIFWIYLAIRWFRNSVIKGDKDFPFWK